MEKINGINICPDLILGKFTRAWGVLRIYINGGTHVRTNSLAPGEHWGKGGSEDPGALALAYSAGSERRLS